MTEALTQPIADDSFQRLVSEVGNEIHTLGCENQNDEDLSSRLMDLACRLWEISKHLPAALSASPAGVVKDIDEGRFEEWTLADFAAQCRMQSRQQLDPEFSRFMAALSARIMSAIEPAGVGVETVPRFLPTEDGEFNGNEWDGELSPEEQALIDAAWEKHKSAGPAAKVINDNQHGRTAIIEILRDPPTLDVGTLLFTVPAALKGDEQ